MSKLAQRLREGDSFINTCIVHLNALRDLTQETVALHVLRDGMRVNVLESESPQSIRHVTNTNARQPASVTHAACDIIMRALASPEQLRRIQEVVENTGEIEDRPSKKNSYIFGREDGLWVRGFVHQEHSV